MRKNVLIFPILTFILLLAPVSSLVGPSPVWRTGDTIGLIQYRDQRNIEDRLVNITSPDGSTAWRYEKSGNNDTQVMEGTSKMGIVKSSANINFAELAPPGSPPFDTVLFNQEENFYTVQGTNRSDYRNVWDMGQNDGTPDYFNGIYYLDAGAWDNSSSYDDSYGYGVGDRNRKDAMPFETNTTYSIIFPEMVDNSIDVRIYDYHNNDYGPGSLSTMMLPEEFNVPLSYRTISTGSRSFGINQATVTLNYVSVMVEFYTKQSGTSTFVMPFGNSGDVSMGANWTVEIHYVNTYTFDSADGMILEVFEDRMVDVDVAYGAKGITQVDGGPTPVDFLGLLNSTKTENSQSYVDNVSFKYGNLRPASNGPNNRGFKEGDFLRYNLEQNNWQESVRDTAGVRNDTGSSYWSENQKENNGRQYNGNITFDVFRIHPDNFESAMFYIADGTEKYDRTTTRTENGVNVNPYEPDEHRTEYRDEVNFDLMAFRSSSSMDLEYFFDVTWYLDGLNLYYVDGSVMDSFAKLPKNSTVSTVTEHMDFNGTTEDNQPIFVNGHKLTWLNVKYYQQLYAMKTTKTVPVQLMDNWNPDGSPQIVDMKFEFNAWARQAWYYDEDTGAMMAMDQESRYEMKISFTNYEYDFSQYPLITSTVNNNVHLNGGTHWFMLLTDHPSLYQTEQGPDPVDHSTPTNNTTPSDTGSSETPGFSLPIPMAPVAFSLVCIAVYARRRKY